MALPFSALSACAGSADSHPASDAASPSTGSTSAAAPAGTPVGPLLAQDAWVKAAESGMTAGFGTFMNPTDGLVTIVSASSSAAADVQLHETAADGASGMVMQEKEGGYPVGPGETLALEPGGYHLMLMGLSAPLLPGDEVTITLAFEDGTTGDLVAAVRDFTGAEEDYGSSDEGGDHAAHGDDTDADDTDG